MVMMLVAASRLRSAAVVVAGLLEGCIVVPRTTAWYDQDCQLVAKHVELQPVQIAQFGGCIDAECGALLAIAGAAAIGSAVISGSIMVVGNALYWIERQGKCVEATMEPPVAAAGAGPANDGKIKVFAGQLLSS